jgi:hypothetical protein
MRGGRHHGTTVTETGVDSGTIQGLPRIDIHYQKLRTGKTDFIKSQRKHESGEIMILNS